MLIAFFGGAAIVGMGTLMQRVLQGEVPGNPLDHESIKPLVLWVAAQGARVAGPGLLAMFVVACLAQFLQVGWLFTTQPIKPNFSRLNPVGGLKKFVNLRNMVKTGVNVIKLGIVGVIATMVLRKHLPGIAALPMLGMAPGMFKVALMGLELASWLLAVLLAIGLIDLFYQRWQHTKDLKMTRQEVKDERRSVDGDPELKARRFRMARDIAMQRIQQAVPKADVIVTNPTHFSVAIKYDPTTMKAPRVVAKGADFLAFKIRHVGIASGVAIVERPPLARGLYWNVKVGQEISPEFYEAVAEVLAYVYRIQGKAA
jgi:flagellar biosynthesis protein FlhB